MQTNIFGIYVTICRILTISTFLKCKYLNSAFLWINKYEYKCINPYFVSYSLKSAQIHYTIKSFIRLL